MIDKALVHRRFARALGTYSGNASVQADTAAKLVAMLPSRPWRRVLEVGCADGLLTRMLMEQHGTEGHSSFEKFFVNDLCEESVAFISDVLEAGAEFIPGDAETVDFPKNLDLLISASTIQWMADLPSFLGKCAASLAPDGILALSTFGPENLKEIRTITGEGLDYYDVESLLGIVPEGMRVVACEQEIVTGTFDSPFDVLRHLKLTGVNGLSGKTWSRSALEAFAGDYWRKFVTETGEVTLTFHPVRIVLVCDKISRLRPSGFARNDKGTTPGMTRERRSK